MSLQKRNFCCFINQTKEKCHQHEVGKSVQSLKSVQKNDNNFGGQGTKAILLQRILQPWKAFDSPDLGLMWSESRVPVKVVRKKYVLGNYVVVISIVSLGLSMFVLKFNKKTAKLTHPHRLAPSKPLTVSILRQVFNKGTYSPLATISLQFITCLSWATMLQSSVITHRHHSKRCFR